MSESTICKTKRDGTITLFDLGSTETYTVAFENGDFNCSIPGRTVNAFLDRGVLGTPPCLRYGDDQPCTGTFSAHLRDASDALVATLLDFLVQSGFVGSDWVSTMGANAEVFTVGITFTFEGTDVGDPADHTITFAYAYVTGSFAEGDPSSISISWTDYEVYPTTA